ncbi:barstar family protein [Gordonia sp. HY002]|uniref:barstar family protein n=1 Tax=Gordonia zhenghanii TaxID=2911516 RepID=UPI001EF0F47B|nr:barstar family protein [Gordonia zhenghanii]MCF8569103.1 barstar family protein [Gordonia zhenghanii]MCF8603422.1 barstar family protein [Gordonia zhenghanii]
MTAVAATAPSLFGTGFAARRVDGAQMRTVGGVLDALATAWDFPAHFGRNRDALDDCMRDLPTGLHTPEGAPSTGWLTIVENASQVLADEPDALEWFAESIDFWRDSYRDARFAVLLVDDDPAAIREKWAAVGVPMTDPAEEI